MDTLNENTISSKEIYKGNIVHLTEDTVSLPNGKEATREVVWHNGGVVIVPITQDSKFVLVRQFRYPTGEVLLEFPAGRLNKEEDPKEAAIRELKEETGYTGNISNIGQIFPAPGFCSELLYLYQMTDLIPGPTNTDEDEFVEVIELTKTELESMIKNGKIKDAKTLAAYTLINTHEA